MSVPVRFVYLALIATSWGIQGIQGQRIIQVLVGQQGDFYDPTVVLAGQGDVVRFFFFGVAHGVAQTSFENPCVPLLGGFSSGVTGGQIADAAKGLIPFWDLKIVNATMPIWYYCPVTRPSSHCAAGMGGVINPPGMGTDAVASFTNSAKQFTGTPIPAGTVLSGIGAFATAPPAASELVTPVTSTSSTMPTTSSPTTSSLSPGEDSRPSSSNIPAIIGGTVAGVVAVLAAIIVIIRVVRRRHRRSQESIVEAYDYPKRPTFPPMTDPRFRGRGKHTIHNATSAEQFMPITVGHAENPDDGRAVNLNSLANEVAAVLLRNASNSRAEAIFGQSARAQDEAPPSYRSDLGDP
ncbi:hypothetical protein VNI00_006978 [Paramarasmius palmivorus]|uniref:Uncharacterized protein n=1 Tax=Paramarasmius palmivorus TaxID=297713 RepID=A0AAW0D3Z7_9AGAR